MTPWFKLWLCLPFVLVGSQGSAEDFPNPFARERVGLIEKRDPLDPLGECYRDLAIEAFREHLSPQQFMAAVNSKRCEQSRESVLGRVRLGLMDKNRETVFWEGIEKNKTNPQINAEAKKRLAEIDLPLRRKWQADYESQWRRWQIWRQLKAI